MSANASSTASLSPFKTESGKRSLLSRLTSPLRSRTRNLTDFHIRPSDPHRQYSPGDLVKGAVVLTVVKPIRITHLTVCLHGFVRVFKHPGGANDPPPVDSTVAVGSNPRKTQYFGNGHASLFQDEVTLCGEGRLEAGVYEFNFELEFPRKGLPTSIDFERGTISYMISSTITRPTSIAATTTCDQKVSLVETVDIGPMSAPKPRVISLEPISRRTRRVRTLKTREMEKESGPSVGKESSGTSSEATGGSPLPDESASQCDATEHVNGNPRTPTTSSDMQSTVSAATNTDSTASSTSFRIAAVSARSTKDSQQSGSKTSLSDKTITATIELLKAGCLPGENLPLKISIKHTKAIKSMHGIIITLYRQGRIDSAPPLSLFVDINAKEAERLKHEEYYPKSKTGLGGLSLTSAGSSSLFRKDLAQTFAPILVDPTTLTCVVNASVRVPEDVFPTITGVPGQMITFKYHVEVVVDLGARLAGQERHIPRVGSVSLPSSFANANGRPDANPNMLSAWGGSIVDTDHIRREKSVVACLFDVTVGTTDSARKRGRGNSFQNRKMSEIYEEEAPQTPMPTHEPIYEETPAMANTYSYHEEQPYPYMDDHYHEHYDHDHHYHHYPEHPPPAHADIHVPPPEIQADEHLTDKERARRAEERLLPSQPPQEGEPSSSSSAGPSAPPVAAAPSILPSPSEEDIYSPNDETPRLEPGFFRAFSHDSVANPLHTPSAPPMSDITPTPTTQESVPSGHTAEIDNQAPTDDKHELERRRMLAEASRPEMPEDDDAGEGSSNQPSAPPGHLEPSAPVITNEEEEYGGAFAHHAISPGPNRVEHGESLPKYER